MTENTRLASVLYLCYRVPFEVRNSVQRSSTVSQKLSLDEAPMAECISTAASGLSMLQGHALRRTGSFQHLKVSRQSSKFKHSLAYHVVGRRALHAAGNRRSKETAGVEDQADAARSSSCNTLLILRG